MTSKLRTLTLFEILNAMELRTTFVDSYKLYHPTTFQKSGYSAVHGVLLAVSTIRNFRLIRNGNRQEGLICQEEEEDFKYCIK
jgi:hypothetical protein